MIVDGEKDQIKIDELGRFNAEVHPDQFNRVRVHIFQNKAEIYNRFEVVGSNVELDLTQSSRKTVARSKPGTSK